MSTHRTTRADCAGECVLHDVIDGLVSVAIVGGAASDATMGRRAFLSRSALAAAAMALAACSGDGSTGPANLSLSVKLSDYSSLATVGGVALVTASGVPIAIVRTGQETFISLSRVCPHEGAIVAPNGTGTGFTCSRHGAQFASSGSWQGGQRTSSMRAFTTTYDAATGIITVG